MGFYWAPNWTILPTIVLPLYILTLSGVLTQWKTEGWRDLLSMELRDTNENRWNQRLDTFSLSFWIVLAVCVLFVFGFQWYGLYGRMHVVGDAGDFQVDRNLLALVRPDIITPAKSLIISMFSFLYIAWHIGVFLSGVLFSYILVDDFSDVCNRVDVESDPMLGNKVNRNGIKLISGIFRCTVLGIWIATLVKLQVIYLLSDGANVVTWLIGDVMSALNLRDDRWLWLDQRSMGGFTTFVLALVTSFIFAVSAYRIRKVVGGFTHDQLSDDKGLGQFVGLTRMLISMTVVVLLLGANVLLIGQFVGFSLLLVACLFVALCSLYNPTFSTRWQSL